MMKFLSLIIALTIPVGVLSQSYSCTNGMVYTTCGSACPLTCDEPSRLFCSSVCVVGCFCPPGMAVHDGRCYDPENCPVTATTTTSPPPTTPTTATCLGDMVYYNCGTACPLTCEQPEPRPCIRICVQGCFCPSDLLEHEGSCVSQSDCPATTPTTPTTTTPTTTTIVPTTQTCTSGMVFQSCGTACPLTCENHQNPPSFCALQCVEGCFCPSGLVKDDGKCVAPSDCPATTPTPTTTTPTTQTMVPTTPTCTSGMIFQSCGTACPLTCENHLNPPSFCTYQCVPGCFCPDGQIQHNGGCVEAADCPVTSCPAGMEYRECGPLCRTTCTPNLGCFSLRCFPGCFCPEGQYEHDGSCLSECPTTTVTTDTTPSTPVIHDLCAVVRCEANKYCQINRTTGNVVCVPDCQRNNGGCRSDQICEVVSLGCDSGSVTDCDPLMYAKCKDPPYVPCGRDAFLACDSEWTYCLQQNKTRRASCVSSCFSQSVYCDDGDSVCTTTMSSDRRPTLQCQDVDDLPSDCPAGQVINQCGSYCQETCEHTLSGYPMACPAICGPPGCVCPQGLVLFRDRCVDPRLCYILVTYPPAINPLPIVDPNTVLLSFNSPQMRMQDFVARPLLDSIESALASRGYSDVTTNVHGVHQKHEFLQIVIQLTGSSISKDSVDSLASLLSENSQALSIQIQEVVPVKVVYINDEPVQELSLQAIIGIAVSSAVAGLAVIVAWIAVVMCCCILRNKPRQSTQNNNDDPNDTKETPITFSELKEKVSDPEKGKLVIESLYN